MNTKPKFCSECGAPLGENDRFCPVCGAKVVDADEPDHKKTPRKKVPTPPLVENENRSTDDAQSEKIATPPPKQKKKKLKFKLWLTIPISMVLFVGISYFILDVFREELLPNVNNVSFSPDNNMLASTGKDNYLEIWNIKQGLSIKRKKIALKYKLVKAVTWDQYSQIIAVSTEEKIKLFDVKDLRQITSISTGKNNTAIALCFDPDGKTLYSVTDHLGISIWDIQEGKRLGGLKNLPNRYVKSASFDGDCQKIATIESKDDSVSPPDKKLIVYQRVNMEKLFKVAFDNVTFNPTAAGLGFDGEMVYALEYADGKFQSWDIHTHRMKETSLIDRRFLGAFTVGKGNNFAIGCWKGVIRIFDEDGKTKQTLRYGPKLGKSLAPIIDLFYLSHYLKGG